MRFRRFGLMTEGANLPGNSWFRACLEGIRARARRAPATGLTRKAATEAAAGDIAGEINSATDSTDRHECWQTSPRQRGVPVFRC